ncbi:MAG: GGDEF domain-containing protein [Atopobiaceae bacterium]|nr:GGDEF domain-containing protein [Atopobiaceae bacterium]
MDFRYAFVYATVTVFCLLAGLIVLSKLDYNMGSEREIHTFRYMNSTFLGFLLCELIWVSSQAQFVPIPFYWGSVFKILSTVLIPLMVYFWFIFAETRFGMTWPSKPLFLILAFVPVAVLVVFFCANIGTRNAFSIDAEGQVVAGPGAAMTGLIDNIYGLAIICHGLFLAAREKTKHRRHVYFTQVVFIAICTAGGVVDAVVSQTPVMPLAITLSFVYLLANIQENQIYNDALTGLNNRRRAERYLLECLADASDENPVHLFMLDINRFKSINDTMGHLEGDRALKVAARAIARSTGELHGFVARWGGDEFVAVVRGNDGDVSERFSEAVAHNLAVATEDQGLSYALEASIGHALASSPATSVSDLIDEADKRLYEQKSLLGVGR